MTLPTFGNYPSSFDDDNNLFLVHDSLRVQLLEDYNPGDTSIQITGDTTNFPPTGFITLTEQCSDPELRALTFYYASRTSTTFDGLELLVGFTDNVKPKRLTNVTQNVMAEHHNSIKDAIIAIEDFIGIQGTTDTRPLGKTMEGRINFLRKLVLRPRAWFKVDKRIGIVPLTVTFCDQSFRNPTSWLWNFGDNTVSGISITIISATSMVPSMPSTADVEVLDLDGGCITKTYYNPGIYSATLTVSNAFGIDTVTFPDLIYARVAAPSEAVISFTPGADQVAVAIPGDLAHQFLSTHLVPGTVTSKANTPISLKVINNGESVVDPIKTYVWKLGDDLFHSSSDTTDASYGIGGLYDIRLRTETEFGAYRSTILQNAINVIEDQNLFLFIFDPTAATGAITKNVSAYEFGLLSETFKNQTRATQSVTRNYNFLSTAIQSSQQTREFLRNNGFAPQSTNGSGSLGTALVYWASGANLGDPVSAQTINFMQYLPFTDTWQSPSISLTRPWNWIDLVSSSNVFFFLGYPTVLLVNSPTNQTLTTLNLTTSTSSDTTWTLSNYKNGADELMNNVGDGTGGDFSVYRTAWKDAQGFVLRNDGIGNFFRLKSFYQTEGVVSSPVQTIRKMPDIPGSVKMEGELVTLIDGVYFFENSGEIAVFDTVASVWRSGVPNATLAPFRNLQDTSVPGFDAVTNTLVAASDTDRQAYLSFDYSTNAFIKFNQVDLTFKLLPTRPEGEQFLAGLF